MRPLWLAAATAIRAAWNCDASPAPERITAALLALCLQSLALAQMVLCAQACDALLVYAMGASAAVGYGPGNAGRVA